ncbi:hypothetical protein V8C86DRAFT_2641617, partial [Haematococcus lacustris]
PAVAMVSSRPLLLRLLRLSEVQLLRWLPGPLLLQLPSCSFMVSVCLHPWSLMCPLGSAACQASLTLSSPSGQTGMWLLLMGASGARVVSAKLRQGELLGVLPGKSPVMWLLLTNSMVATTNSPRQQCITSRMSSERPAHCPLQVKSCRSPHSAVYSGMVAKHSSSSLATSCLHAHPVVSGRGPFNIP